MAGTEGPRRALAMDEETSGLSVDNMLLDFAGVMGNIVQQRECRLREEIGEDLPDQVRDDLTIGKGAIDCRAHRAEILLPHLRIDRGTGQFPIRQFDMVPSCVDGHALEKLCADLMAESARTAMDADDKVSCAESEDRCRFCIEDLHDLLHFEIMVP